MLFKKMVLRHSVLFLALLSAFACSKDTENLLNPSYKAEPEGTRASENFECEYVLEQAPTSILQMLANTNDPKEEELDIYMYYIARAVSKYTCVAEDFEGNFMENSFTRYDGTPGNGPAEIEVEVQDLVSNSPSFLGLLNNELSTINESWSSIKPKFVWKGFFYTPTVWLENQPVADWSLAPLIGVGADIEYSKDAIGDFIPVLLNECEPDEFKPVEMVLGKVHSLQGVDTVVTYTSQCIENPVLVVQLSWDKNKKSAALSASGSIPPGWLGETYDTIIPNTPPPGPGCDMADNFELFMMTMDCNRYDRSRYSELAVAHYALPTGPGNLASFPYDSESSKLKNVHKNDKCNLHTVSHFYYEQQTGSVNALGQGSYNLYSITFEYDWYTSSKGWDFPKDRGVTPRIEMKRKGSHTQYQIAVIKPTDWCFNTVKFYQAPGGFSFIIGRKL